MTTDYELSPEQEQFVLEANERSRIAREEREANRIQRAEKLEGRRAEYSAIRGQLAEINHRLSDLNGKYNSQRVELGDAAQEKINAAGVLRKDTIAAARQEYIETRRAESRKYQEVFKAVTGQLQQDSDAVGDDFDDELDEIRRERKVVADQLRNFSWD